MGVPLRVLIVEDSESDFLILVRELRRGGYDPLCERVETGEAMSAALDREAWDVILIDYTLPRFCGIAALELIKRKQMDLPAIVVSRTITDEIAVAAMKAGAHDYIMKNNLTRLVPVVERELQAAKGRLCDRMAEETFRENDERYRSLFDAIDEGFCIIEVLFDESEKPIDYRFLSINPSFERQTGLIGAQGKRMRELAPKYEEHWFEMYGKIAVTGRPVRFVNRTEQLHQWYDVHAFRLGKPENRQVAILFNDITKHKQTEEELQQSRAQMRAFAGRLQATREEERTQIAREIHDELGGALTAMKIDFSLLARTVTKVRDKALRDSLHSRMGEMTELIDATMQTVRRIATALRPGILDDLGLVAALEWQLADFQKRTGIRCEFHSSSGSANLDGIRATALFRIAQEALTNVARHARATEVHIRLQADASAILLEVKDNGVGIKEEDIRNAQSLGILGMRERALSFGGRVTITGRPGEGTMVAVESPPPGREVQDQETDE